MGAEQRDHQHTKKPVRATVREETGATFMLRCQELHLSMEDLDEMSMGMVFDMLIEQANDQEQYPYKATQKDIDEFFGGG